VIIDKGAVDQAVIIAMATHGRSGVDRFLIGSVAEKVLRGSANPLLLVRASKEADNVVPDGFRTIIVALDGSELAERILPAVAELAKKLEAEILLFRAYHIPYSVYTGDEAFYAVGFEEMTANVRAEAEGYVEKKAAGLRSSGVEKVTCLAKEGLAGDEIIAVAKRMPNALIAMCSHGRSGVKRWVLGSVTETVVRHADDPVLVVRAG
jgi:nucleotide-binding universal stress UspA family protein